MFKTLKKLFDNEYKELYRFSKLADQIDALDEEMSKEFEEVVNDVPDERSMYVISNASKKRSLSQENWTGQVPHETFALHHIGHEHGRRGNLFDEAVPKIGQS